MKQVRQLTPVKGFSKLSREAKTEWLISHYSKDPVKGHELLESYRHADAAVQRLHDEFIENTLTNYYLPFGIAPNFLIDGDLYALPMAIEESSVVAAASKAANFWLERGGFHTEIISTTKIGHVHFYWMGADPVVLRKKVADFVPAFEAATDRITANMRARGGGILSIQLVDKTALEKGYFQLAVKFDTRDSMGANFINSCLEAIAESLQQEMASAHDLSEQDRQVEVIMRILSNFTPECLVRASVSCPVDAIEEGSGIGNTAFAERFVRAVRIAEIEPYRAVTHNKGIMNGIDAVVIATGNDFRAVEACAHAYAARNGQYGSLTHAKVENGVFHFWIDMPLSLGTVGGITSLHPMVKFALEILGQPSAEKLMRICAVAGLAQNFSALRSLVTTGIQKGHMKMHLLNILNQLEATDEEKARIVEYFKDKVVSHQAAVEIFCQIRGIHAEQLATRKH
jgi:hydroxymethylglutaryl-CoA reductase